MKGTSTEYAQAFGMFLACTNEKKVFLDVLKEKIATEKISSILDIGAGNGDLAIPLSKLVGTYVAVEPVPEYAKYLKEKGLTVIESLFPCAVSGIFDLVLISHSLPWKAPKYEPFIKEAWKLLNANGQMLVITYDNESGDWYQMLKNCGLPPRRSMTNHIGALTSFISSTFSKSTRKDIVTTIVSKDLEEIMHALAFVWSDGEPAHFSEFMKSDTVRKYLTEHYSIGNSGYSFTFTHIFLNVEK